MQDDLKIIKHISKDLLKNLGFPEANIEAEKDEDQRIKIQIDVEPEESGLLIGFHGETIYALQLIINQMVAKRLDEWKNLSVNIGDYREKRRQSLTTLANNAAQKAKQLNEPVTLPYLNSNERRIVHVTLSQDSQVKTYSQGQGKQRRLIIEPLSEKQVS